MQFLDENLLQTRLNSSVQCDIAKNKICGAALHVSQAGKVLYQNCIGSSDPIENTPVTDTTVFRLASMTKPITAVATLMLAERGALQLDDPVEKYYSQFRNMRIASVDNRGRLSDAGPANTKVTIRHILTHTSGIGSGLAGVSQIGAMTAVDKASLENTILFFAEQGLSFEPFTKQEYSGFPAFDVLTGILEKVADEDYRQFLNREIFSVCDMPDTTFVPSEEQLNRMAVMHDRKNGKSCIGKTTEGCIFSDIPCTHYLGGAGLVSTLRDYAHFAQMLLCNGQYAGKQILLPASVASISTAQLPSHLQPGVARWGLGVRVIVSDDGHNLPLGAYGWSGAYGCHFWIDPINEITAVYMKNSLYDPGAGSLTGSNFEADVYHSFKA